MKCHLFLAGLVALLLSFPTGAAACLRANTDGESAKGQIVLVDAKDGAGRSKPAYMMALPVPVCLMGPKKRDHVKRTRIIHIWSSNDKIAAQIARFVGQIMRVRGNPIATHALYRDASIKMNISWIETQ